MMPVARFVLVMLPLLAACAPLPPCSAAIIIGHATFDCDRGTTEKRATR